MIYKSFAQINLLKIKNMKAIRFFSNSTNGKFVFSIIVNKKALIEKITKFIVVAYSFISVLCGVAATLMMSYCIEQSSISFDQIVAIVACSIIFLSFIRLINKKAFDEFFLNIWEIIKEASLNTWTKVSCMYDKK